LEGQTDHADDQDPAEKTYKRRSHLGPFVWIGWGRDGRSPALSVRGRANLVLCEAGSQASTGRSECRRRPTGWRRLRAGGNAMPVGAIAGERGPVGKDVAAGLGESLGLPVIYHEVIDHLADRMRVRRSHVVKLLDGKAGLFERLTADQTSLFIHSADEIIGKTLEGRGAVIRGWGATHLLRDIQHVVTVRVCAPLQVRRKRMLERLNTRDVAQVAEEIHRNDEAHTAIVKRHYGLQWTDPEHYDLVLNTERLSVEECVEEVLSIVR